MITFPQPDTLYNHYALGAWACVITRGVFANGNDISSFDVTPAGGMTINVSGGIGWHKPSKWYGAYSWLENDVELPVALPQGLETATAAVTVQLDLTTGTSDVIIKTNPDGSPPEAVTIGSVRELVVAYVSLRHNQAVITAADIRDTRMDESLCGIARNGLDSVPTQTLYDQFMGLLALLEAALDDDTAGRLLAMINTISNNLDDHKNDTDNPHSVTAAQVGLGNVNNTADANKTVRCANRISINSSTDLEFFSTETVVRSDSAGQIFLGTGSFSGIGSFSELRDINVANLDPGTTGSGLIVVLNKLSSAQLKGVLLKYDFSTGALNLYRSSPARLGITLSATASK